MVYKMHTVFWEGKNEDRVFNQSNLMLKHIQELVEKHVGANERSSRIESIEIQFDPEGIMAQL